MTPWKPADAGGKCLFPDLLASGCWKLLGEIGYKGAGLKNTLGQHSFKHLQIYLQLFGPFSLFLLSLIDFFFFYSSRTPVHVAVITTPTPASPTGTTCHHASQTPPTSSFFPTTNGKVSSIISWEFQLAQCSINIHRKLKWHWRSYAEEQTFKTLN